MIFVLALAVLGIFSPSLKSNDNDLFDVDYPADWSMNDGKHIIFERVKRHDTIKIDKDKIIFALPGTELVLQIVQSDNKQFLLCRIAAYRKDALIISSGGSVDGIPYDYVSLARISKIENQWSFTRLMTKQQLGLAGVSELGAISDDGERALLKIGESWEVRNLQTLKVIKKGFSIK